MTELQSTGRRVTDPEVAELAPWFHNLHLPSGTQTAPDHPLGDFPAFKWSALAPAIPTDLRGCRALDIGCNAGFYSFELARRGADVLAIDHDPHYLRQAEWAGRQLDLHDRVELRQMGVYDLAHVQETFDLVLFMGVLYHLRHPLLALDIVAERTSGTLVLQTLTVPGVPEHAGPDEDVPFGERRVLREPWWPMMAFVEHRLAGDPTNWWVPTPAAVEGMARSAGLRITSQPAPETWLCERAVAFEHAAELDAATGRAPRTTGQPGAPSSRK
jgi:tRNA (mo5U34)-methyltransferase